MSMRASPQKQEEKERVRLSLLRAALVLGATHGFASLGLREVARAAGIAPTSFYRHFADMLELGAALVEDLVGPLLQQLARPVEREDTAARGRSLSAGVLRIVEREPELARFVIAERVGAFPTLRNALAQQLEQLARALSDDPLRARTALALLMDGLARMLDAAPAERSEAAAGLARALIVVLETREP